MCVKTTSRDPSRKAETRTGKFPRAERPPPRHPARDRAPANCRGEAAAPTAEARRREAGDHARPYLPSSRRAGIMDASSSPWSPMLTPTERLSKQPPPGPGSSTAASGESGAPTGARAVQNSSRKPLSAATRRRLFRFR